MELSPEQFVKVLQGQRGRVLAVDVGSKTLGLAVSGRNFAIASPLQTIKRSSWPYDISLLRNIIDEYHVLGVIVGWPMNMDDTEGPRCRMVKNWIAKLNSFIDIPVCVWDERLSTVAANDIMLGADVSRKRRSELVDKVAASYILQTFLAQHPHMF